MPRFDQAGVDSVEVLVQQPLVASRPSLFDSVSAQLRHQRLRPGLLQLARPVKQVDVGIDDVWRGIGTAVRLLALNGAPRQRPKRSREQHSFQKSPPGQLPHDCIHRDLLRFGKRLTIVTRASVSCGQWRRDGIVQPALTADRDIPIGNESGMGAAGIGVRRIALAHRPGGWTTEERWTGVHDVLQLQNKTCRTRRGRRERDLRNLVSRSSLGAWPARAGIAEHETRVSLPMAADARLYTPEAAPPPP
jgi:hypothetical protein